MNHSDSTTSLLIDGETTAHQLGIGSRTLWSLTNRDAIPSRRIGRSVRYSPAELEAWVESGCPTEPGAASKVRKAMTKGGKC